MSQLIAPNAVIQSNATISDGVRIDSGAYIGERTFVGELCEIGRQANIADRCFIDHDVVIGPNVSIESSVLILSGAKICPNNVRSVSSDGRSIGKNSIIGAGVLLHDEVELGVAAVVPHQSTIAMIGNFGSKNRVVTIYGSRTGPLYSIGCLVGKSFEYIKDDISRDLSASARTYEPYLEIFRSIGSVVQEAFNDQSSEVDELLELYADTVPQNMRVQGRRLTN